MIEETHFGLFISAATLLAITPGPGILYVLGRTLHGGKGEGVQSAVGTFLGGSFHVLAAGLGLSSILLTSAAAFRFVRYAGAIYLVYLGISMIRSRTANLNINRETGSSERSLLQGILTEALNPKTALFFLAFIPQFISPAGHPTLQFLFLGIISVCLNTAVDFVVIWLAAPIASRFMNRPDLVRKQRTASGVGMIGLGVYVAASK
jgi:threonine/homoserine/homoserine lactone efflux protein